MTAETIHTCSYSCERPECIRAQRDELAARLTAETSNARGEWVLVPRVPTEAMIDAWRDAPNRWVEAYAAMLAAAPQPPSAPDYPITATCRVCDCDYRCVPIPAKCGACGADLPPSTPVGVKTLSEFMAEQEALHPGIHDKVQAATDELRARLAQQPAADPRSTHRVWRGDDWQPCYCEATNDHRIGSEQPAAVDEAMVERAWVAFCESAGSARQGIRAALTAALATKHQEPTT